jgi:hypothetical protein
VAWATTSAVSTSASTGAVDARSMMPRLSDPPPAGADEGHPSLRCRTGDPLVLCGEKAKEEAMSERDRQARDRDVGVWLSCVQRGLLRPPIVGAERLEEQV